MNTNNLISPMKFCYNTSFIFLNKSKDLDLSYKTDLDFWDCFGRKKLCLIIQEIWYLSDKSFCCLPRHHRSLYTQLSTSWVHQLIWIYQSIHCAGGALVAQWVKHWPTDLVGPGPEFDTGLKWNPYHKRGCIAHSLSLPSAHHPDITEILLKRM